jgi:hypothetical protein
VRDQGPRCKKMHDALAVNGDFPRGNWGRRPTTANEIRNISIATSEQLEASGVYSSCVTYECRRYFYNRSGTGLRGV